MCQFPSPFFSPFHSPSLASHAFHLSKANGAMTENGGEGGGLQCTYMHVQHLAITSVAADGSRHDDQLVLCHKVADAAFLARRLGSRMCLDLELEGQRGGQKRQEQQPDHDAARQIRLHLWRGNNSPCARRILFFFFFFGNTKAIII